MEKRHNIEVNDIEALCDESEKFIKDINHQIEQLIK